MPPRQTFAKRRKRLLQSKPKKTEALVKKLSKKTSDAEKAIADAKTDALTGVAEAASEIAREATEKLIGVKVQAKTADKAVSAIVGE